MLALDSDFAINASFASLAEVLPREGTVLGIELRLRRGWRCDAIDAACFDRGNGTAESVECRTSLFRHVWRRCRSQDRVALGRIGCELGDCRRSVATVQRRWHRAHTGRPGVKCQRAAADRRTAQRQRRAADREAESLSQPHTRVDPRAVCCVICRHA